jgi:hypothetical protein
VREAVTARSVQVTCELVSSPTGVRDTIGLSSSVDYRLNLHIDCVFSVYSGWVGERLVLQSVY